MLKRILILGVTVLISACAGGQLKQIPPQVRATKKVDFFAGGHTQAAFKVTGAMNNNVLEGVMVIKKIGEGDFDISVMSTGAYRVMQATLTPAGIAYRYLFPDADTALVRGKIHQFLNLLVLDVGVYQRLRVENNELAVTYKNPSATVRLKYVAGQVYPHAASTSVLLNTADLTYSQYAPADSSGWLQVPHEMVYKDGKIEIVLTLISLK